MNPDKGWGLWGCFNIHSSAFLGWLLVRPMGFFINDKDIELALKSKHGANSARLRLISWPICALITQKQFSAIAMPSNKASIKVMTKLGMEFVKQGVHYDPLGDLDVVYYLAS